jgi:hypothetical protein
MIEKHIIDFCEWAKTQPCDVTVIDVKKRHNNKIKNIL